MAGEVTPAPCGHVAPSTASPRATVTAVRSGSTSVFNVTRTRVADAVGRIRSSTRSAALSA